MKKLILLSLSGLLLLVLFNKPNANAQGFQIVASFGTTQAWNVPTAIEYEIYDYYPYHNWVHVNRVQQGRRIFYNILLERDGFYTELQFGRYSRLLRTQYYADYPLYNHFCSAHCGYHNAYFNSHRIVNNNHFYYGGHNHFVYRPQPRHITQPVRPQSVRYTEYGNRNRNNRVVATDTRVVRSNSSNNRSEPVRVSSNSRSNNNRTVAPARSNASAARSVRTNTASSTRSVRPTATNERVNRTPQAAPTRSVSSKRTVSNNRNVSSRSTAGSSRSAGTSVATNRKASEPAVKSNSRGSSSSRSASTSGRTASSSSRGSGRGN
jgi:hypothetical protein